MNKKKKIFILGALAVVIIGALVFILIRNQKIKSDQGSLGAAINNVYEPQFMSAAEKASLSLPADSKIQILKTDEAGKAEVYRIIRRDADIVLDPSRVGEPGMTQPASQPAAK